MTIENPSAINPSLIARIKGILVQPKVEWAVIDAEPATVKSIFVPYALILAAIGPIASLIGGQLFPVMGMRMPLIAGIVSAVIGYAMALISVFILSLIIDALAPTFGGVKSKVQATKVAVYSSTATWLAAIFGLVPMLAILSIVGLYSFYLMYLGLPRLMKVPEDKALVYTVVVVIAAIVVIGLAMAITAVISGLMVAGAIGAGAVAMGGL